jgi:hypothetical protein
MISSGFHLLHQGEFFRMGKSISIDIEVNLPVPTSSSTCLLQPGSIAV